MKPISVLYLLADDQTYRLLRGHGAELVEIALRTADAFPDVEDLQNGRRHPGAESGPHGRTEEIERDRFARHVVRALTEEWEKSGSDRIVISAGPKMLGVLRKALPKSLTAHVAAELHKDLVKIPAHDLPPHLGEVPAV